MINERETPITTTHAGQKRSAGRGRQRARPSREAHFPDPARTPHIPAATPRLRPPSSGEGAARAGGRQASGDRVTDGQRQNVSRGNRSNAFAHDTERPRTEKRPPGKAEHGLGELALLGGGRHGRSEWVTWGVQRWGEAAVFPARTYGHAVYSSSRAESGSRRHPPTPRPSPRHPDAAGLPVRSHVRAHGLLLPTQTLICGVLSHKQGRGPPDPQTWGHCYETNFI